MIETRSDKLKKFFLILSLTLICFSLTGLPLLAAEKTEKAETSKAEKKEEKKEKEKKHPYDFYNHEMHMPLFEAANVACDRCHADPDSYGNRKKVNPQGCHTCHRDPNPPLPATQDCKLCHKAGPPKPQSHQVDWLNKHQVYAKTKADNCTQCHQNEMFCINCHQRRDTIQEVMHRRNFKFFHSIEARANPRKCTTCHTINYCQTCHEGRGNSSK